MFHEHLRAELAGVTAGEQVAVHYIDIDEFKGVNDALGHLVGDELLKSVAASLSRCIGPADFVARLGGDEFAIVQSAVTSPDQVNELVARVFQAIRAPYDCMVPLIRALSGRSVIHHRRERAVLGRDVGANDQREDYLRARLETRDDGTLIALPVNHQDSSLLANLAAAQALLVRAPFAPKAEAGTPCEVLRLPV